MGMALVAMDRKAEALVHFRRANEADSQGYYGRRSAKAMHDFGSQQVAKPDSLGLPL